MWKQKEYKRNKSSDENLCISIPINMYVKRG